LTATGTVLGVFPDAEYRTGEVSLRSRDRLLLYTDGITEALNRTDEEFGDDRLAAALTAHRDLDAEGLHRALLAEVTDFTAGRGFQDDATLIVVAVR
jgi:sigma-B regulation protein RsbU (phosphoserine phosphatase)